MATQTKQCQNCKKEFTIYPEDLSFYEKINVPPPTWCPECRLRRRMIFRNERALYKRKCELCNKNIIAMFSSDRPQKVYCNPCWWSDKWDGVDYGRDYDFSKPFFEQVKELIETVPWNNLLLDYWGIVNSEYTNYAGYLKNCYLVFNTDTNENCCYGASINNSKDSFDIDGSYNCELSYSCYNCLNCYKTLFSVDCQDCQEIVFSKNCIGCNNCFGCMNLRNKSYHIFNKPYSKEEYFNKIKEFDIGSYKNIDSLSQKAADLWIKYPVRYIHGYKNKDVSGDYIYNSKNTHHSFEVLEAEDCKYCQFLSQKKSVDCYDYSSWGQGAEHIYESDTAGEGVYFIKFGAGSRRNSKYLEYCLNCCFCSNLFGCVNLTNKQYCILNKQYTKEEYEKMIPKIRKHMDSMPYTDKKGRIYKYGEFFPTELSPFAYNETASQEYFPLTKEQALEQGYTWKDPEDRDIKIDIHTNELPDNIKDVKHDIVNKIIQCEHRGECNEQCTTAFKIIPQELEFYKKMNLPLPRLCPNCRHYQRIKHRNPLKLWHRKCMCDKTDHFHGNKPCPNEFETTYSPDRKEIVYCEECYKREVS